MDDLISRQAAIDALIAEGRNVDSRYLESERIIHESDAVEVISLLPSAQPEEIALRALHESCTDCPLYDKDRYNCPRFNKVIPETLRELQSAHPEQKTGKWIEHEWAGEAEDYLISYYECSCCHTWERTNSYYCPNCGCQMREGEDNEQND